MGETTTRRIPETATATASLYAYGYRGRALWFVDDDSRHDKRRSVVCKHFHKRTELAIKCAEKMIQRGQP